jgi:LacI family transcriptional regulator
VQRRRAKVPMVAAVIASRAPGCKRLHFFADHERHLIGNSVRGSMVTIKDVAREADVSVATVSRVFSGANVVREETSRRIREVASAMRYSPHGGARSLITSKTQTLGVLLPELYGDFFSEIIRGIDLAARRRGFHLLISSSHSDRREVESALRSMRGRVDGVILMSPDLDAEALVSTLPGEQPVMLLNSCVRRPRVASVRISNSRGACEMVRHLVAHGHRRIAMITGPAHNIDGDQRRRGYRSALSEAGIPLDRELEVPGNFTEDSGFDAARVMLQKRSSRPTAIFAANDAMAVGALSALRDAGVKVPKEMAVAGFDDIPLARHMSPALSSVHVPIAELGERAAERIIAALTDPDGTPTRHEILRTTLVIRGSCGPPGHT